MADPFNRRQKSFGVVGAAAGQRGGNLQQHGHAAVARQAELWADADRRILVRLAQQGLDLAAPTPCVPSPL